MVLRAADRTIEFCRPLIMGILNLNADSFFEGSRVEDTDALVERAAMMIEQGASILDVGAMSSRPGATEISHQEELDRLIPAIKVLRSTFPGVILSSDTYRSEVARAALEAGAHMINDITGGAADNKMFAVISEFKAACILMHMQGTPATMQNNPQYHDVVGEVKAFLVSQAAKAARYDIGTIIIDPGIGFGKTVEHNYQLLGNLSDFCDTGYPVMVGVSRKSLINKMLGTLPAGALNGTTVLHTIALLNGAAFLRVHDVKEAVETVILVEKFLVSNNKTLSL